MKPTEVYRVLASADRQLVLHELLHAGQAATVGDLARRVAAHRHRVCEAAIGDDAVDRARLRLVHTHLPMLQDLDVVTWDDDAVRLRDNETVERLFDAASEVNDWPPDDLLHEPPQ